MVETPRNGPNHKNHPKHQEKTWKQSDVTFFLEWVYEFVLLFEEETPLCFFSGQKSTWTPSRVQIFINRGGDDYHPGIRKRVSPQPWDETQQLYQGVEWRSYNHLTTHSPDAGKYLLIFWKNPHYCKTQNIQSFAVFKWSIFMAIQDSLLGKIL